MHLRETEQRKGDLATIPVSEMADPDAERAKRQVNFATAQFDAAPLSSPIGQDQGGGYELGGYDISEQSAKKLREGDMKRNSTMQVLRRTIFKAPTMSLIRSETDDELEISIKSSKTNILLWVVGILAVPAVGAYLWLQEQARLEAERAAAAAAASADEGALFSMLVVVALAAPVIYLVKGGAASSAAEGEEDEEEDEDDSSKTWKRRHSYPKEKGTTPPLRRHNTEYHD